MKIRLEWLLSLLATFMDASPDAEDYSGLLHKKVGVLVEPLTVISNASSRSRCQLTLHKDLCVGPPLLPTDTIAWNTRICLKWHCRAEEHAMKVENCWVGSVNNPVQLIGKDGCSLQSTMINSPMYDDKTFRTARSIGWLSVRQVGMEHIHVGCTIRLCHLCDPECREQTPPRRCKDQPRRDFARLWNESAAVHRACILPAFRHAAASSPSSTLPSTLASFFIFVYYLVLERVL